MDKRWSGSWGNNEGLEEGIKKQNEGMDEYIHYLNFEALRCIHIKNYFHIHICVHTIHYVYQLLIKIPQQNVFKLYIAQLLIFAIHRTIGITCLFLPCAQWKVNNFSVLVFPSLVNIQVSNIKVKSYIFFCWEGHIQLTIFGSYWQCCTQESLLTVLGEPHGMTRIKPGSIACTARAHSDL